MYLSTTEKYDFFFFFPRLITAINNKLKNINGLFLCVVRRLREDQISIGRPSAFFVRFFVFSSFFLFTKSGKCISGKPKYNN